MGVSFMQEAAPCKSLSAPVCAGRWFSIVKWMFVATSFGEGNIPEDKLDPEKSFSLERVQGDWKLGLVMN